MRVLCIASYYWPAIVYGGPVRSLAALCEAMAGHGAAVTVLTTDANGPERLDVPLRRPVEANGVTVVYYPLVEGLPRGFFYAPELARACVEQVGRADVALLETLWTHAMGPAASACRRAGIPYVVPLRGQLLPASLGHRALRKRVYLAAVGRGYLDGAAGLHCTCEEEAAGAAALGLRAPTFIIPNGLRLADAEVTGAAGFLRNRLHLPPGARVVGMLGRLHPLKRPHVALEAVAQLADGTVHLVYMGPDEHGLAPRLRAEAERRGCAGRVHFTGLLDRAEVTAALSDTDLLVMPSSAMENFGMAALEAMAAGVPVLTSPDVPTGRWAAEAGAGHLAPATAEGFAVALRGLFSKSADLGAMGVRGQDLVRRRFEARVVGRQMLDQLRAIVETGRPSPAGSPT